MRVGIDRLVALFGSLGALNLLNTEKICLSVTVAQHPFTNHEVAANIPIFCLVSERCLLNSSVNDDSSIQILMYCAFSYDHSSLENGLKLV